jgi:hypothetical protein
MSTGEIVEVNRLSAIIRPSRVIDGDTIFAIQLMAPAFHQCRWYGISSEAQAIALMIKAATLGIPPASAFDFFDIVESRPALKPIGALALIHASGLIDVHIDDSAWDSCTVTMRRRDTGYQHTVTYSVEDARRSGLLKPDKPNAAWSRFVKDMCRNRSVGRCAKIVGPDVLGGMVLTIDIQDAQDQTTELIESRQRQIALRPDNCDHFAAVSTDTHCPTCGAELSSSDS